MGSSSTRGGRHGPRRAGESSVGFAFSFSPVACGVPACVKVDRIDKMFCFETYSFGPVGDQFGCKFSPWPAFRAQINVSGLAVSNPS